MSVCSFAQTTVSLFPSGKVTMSEPVEIDMPGESGEYYGYGWYPDGKFCFLPETDGSGWVCYWGEGDTYRTKAATTHLEDHIANNNWQLAFGGSVNPIDGFNDGGSWVIGMHRLENGKLVGFFHAESWWPSGSGAHKSIGVTYSTDNGLTWEPGKCILAASYPKPQEAAWTGLGDGCVVWNPERQQYICYFQEVEVGGICMAASSDPEGAAGTWKKWDGDDFTIEGCNQQTLTGGKGVMVNDIDIVPGCSPSVMWNEYLNCWLMAYAKWGGDFYLSMSKDGIEWSAPTLLLTEPVKPVYANLVSDKGDVIGGKNLRLYYSRNMNEWGLRRLAYRTIELDYTEDVKWANIVKNSDLEGDDVSCFYSIENGAGGGEFKPSTIVDGAGRYKSRGIVVQSADNPPEFWDTQFFVRLPQSLPAGTKYRLSFRGKASQEAYVTMESHAEPGDYIWWDFGSVNFTTSWHNFVIEGTINELQSTDDKKMRTIAFDLARMNTATTYYFDDIVFEIDPSLVEQPVTITAENKTMTYGDDIPALTYTSTGAKLNGTPNLVTTATKTSPVGTYPIKVEQGTVMNSNVTFVDGTLTITQAPLTVGVQDVTITEGDAIPTFTMTYDGWRNSDNADNAFTTMPVASTTATPSSAPGVYPITISGGEATNYALTYTQGTLTIKENETITSGDLVLNGDLEDDELRCFFARENLLENEEIVPATIVNGAGKDGSRGVVLHSANVSSEAEGHNTQLFVRLTQQVPAGTKYRLSFDYKASQNADVWIQTQAEPSDYIWWNFGNVTFTPSWQHFEREGTITDEESTSEKKMRTIAFNLAENKSATIYYFDNISFIINPAPVEQPVTITANNLTMIYGDEVPELTFTSKGAALEGTPKLSTTATKTSPVGTYPIKVEQGTVTNTKVTYVDGTLTITKAPLTIKAGTYTRKQGEVNPEFTLSYEGFKNNETKDVLKKQPTVSCNATESSVPGKYPVTVSGAEATNYEITYVNGTLIVTAASFKLTYLVDGEVYKTYYIEYGTAITPEPAPTKEGYTFSGWSKIPETMPAHDVTVTGTFAVNQYTITYVIDNEVYTTQRVDYGSIIVPPVAPTREGYDFAWSDYPETMPAYDITIYGTYTTGIEAIIAGEANCQIFSLDGKPLNKPQKGVNIVRMGNGQVRKVVVK